MNISSKDQCEKNKNMYYKLTNTMHGAGSGWKLIDDKKKKQILKDYQTIINGSKPCISFPKKVIESAISGIELDRMKKKSKSKLCSTLLETHEKNKGFPFIHEDSLSAWANQGVEKVGLTVRDIKNMKFGEKMEVILMDRNSGENIPGKKGSKFMPTVDGFSIATYIHGEKLTGLLNFKKSGVIHAPFEWEINRAAVGDNYFWGPLSECNRKPTECNRKPTEKISPMNPDDLDPNILVGWRGPAIRMSDALKHLPKYAVKYDTWWDDYVVFKYTDFLHKK